MLEPEPELELELELELVTVPGQASGRAEAAPGGARHSRTDGWPCAPCGAQNALDATVCGTCGSIFLVDLHTEDPVPLRIPYFGNVSRLGRATISCIAIGIAVVFALLIYGLLALAGILFR